MYGACANRYFRYFETAIAEGITMTGQTVIRFIANAINVKLNEVLETEGIDYVIGSDTDSVMVDVSAFMTGYQEAVGTPDDFNELVDVCNAFVETNLEEAVLKPKFLELAALLGSKACTLSMKREAIADRGLFRAKKHYVLQVWDNEGVRYKEAHLKMVGIETARTTTPALCRAALEESLKVILNGSRDEMEELYQKFRLDFFGASADKIAFPRGVSNVTKYEEGDGAKKGTPVQSKAALCYNYLLRKHDLRERDPIRDGSKLKFVYLKKNNPTGYNVVGFLDDLPAEFGLDEYIDREEQFDKAFAKPLSSFTELIPWMVGKKAAASLADDMFDEEVGEATVKRKSTAVTPRAAEPRKPVERKAAPRKKVAKPTLSFDD